MSNRRHSLTEDKCYCPTEDKGYCPAEDKGYHKVSHSHKPIPSNTHLIESGSQTTCTRKLSYHDSCTLCKGSALYPRVVISSPFGD
jgi:hypothetical protein